MLTGATKPADAMNGIPLRVLHVASGDLWAGAEAQIFTLLTHLCGTGEVELLAVLLNDGELAERLRRAGIDVAILDEAALGSMAILRKLRELISEFDPHVVHTHRQKENVLGALANLSTRRAPMVRTQHGAPEHLPRWSQPAKLLAMQLNRWSARLTHAAIIAVSKPLAADLSRQAGSKHVQVIENGVDADAIVRAQRPAPFRRAAPQAMHVGFLGRLEPVKRADVFLEIASVMCRDRPREVWRFHVFGDGRLRPDLEQRRRSLGIEGCLEFHGHDPQAAAYLRELDAIVLCSDHEGLPMVVLEAMAVGVPVVAHSVGGLPDALSGRPCAALVRSQDPHDYVAPLARLASARASQRPGLAPGTLPEKYDAGTNSRRTLALYRSLVGAR
jgi:L-malate glycosyltransferase